MLRARAVHLFHVADTLIAGTRPVDWKRVTKVNLMRDILFRLTGYLGNKVLGCHYAKKGDQFVPLGIIQITSTELNQKCREITSIRF